LTIGRLKETSLGVGFKAHPPLGFTYPKPQGKGYMNLNINNSQGGRAGFLCFFSPLATQKRGAARLDLNIFGKIFPIITIISRGKKLKSPYLNHGFLHIASIYQG
jgi:hypothetical protein